MKKNKFSNKKWTEGFKKQLIDMINNGKSVGQIAKELGRSISSIYNEARRLKISFKIKDK